MDARSGEAFGHAAPEVDGDLGRALGQNRSELVQVDDEPMDPMS